MGACVLQGERLGDLPPFRVQPCAVSTERLPASAFPAILRLDVVAFRAFGVVVMHGLLDGMPWTLSRHE